MSSASAGVPAGEVVAATRDVDAEVRRSEGLRRLSALARELLAEPEPSVHGVLGMIAQAARDMTGAASAVVMLPSAAADDVGQRVTAGAEVPDGGDCSAPLVAGADVLGSLTVGRPVGAPVFDDVDSGLLVDLAAHASVAIRWAQGREKEQARTALRAEIVRTARHDIRNPVGAGKGYVRLLLTRADRMSPDQTQTALASLQQVLERIETMTEQLLVDEELELVGAKPRWSPVPLAPLLSAVCRDASVVTGREDAVVLDIDAEAAPVVAGDAGMLRQVVDNLVGNALKHAPASGPVVVAVVPAGDLVRLEVRDRGPGIPVEEQAGLFRRWSRLEGTRLSGTAGFGLGLSIVNRLVEAHGGSVGVVSEPDEGATFWVTLPTEPPEAAQQPEPARDA